jgi:transposase
MKLLSLDLRQRIVNAVKNEKLKPKEVASRFAVDLSNVYRFLQLNRDLNSLVPSKPTG